MESLPAENRQELESYVLQAYRKSPLGFDLIVSAFLQALHSHRRLSVCTPFPTFLFTKDGDKDFAAVEAAVHHFPDIHREFRSQAVHSERPLESLKLLNWLLRLRYHVQPVVDTGLELPREFPWIKHGGRGDIAAGSGQLPDYILKLQESDVRVGGAFSTFEENKLHFGSIFAFHGTPAENLHSILRCGLLILSNSSLQRNGAIFGEGIYLSTDPTVALGFCKSGKGWEHSYFGEQAKYLLACEVAKGDKVVYSGASNSEEHKNSSHKNLGTYTIVQNCDLVKLRYVLVYVQHSNRGVYNLRRDFNPTQAPIAHSPILSKVKRVDWCKVMILLYAILLLGIAYFNYSSASKIGVRQRQRMVRK